MSTRLIEGELGPLKKVIEVKEALEDVVANLQKTYPRLKGRVSNSDLNAHHLDVYLQVSDGNLSLVMGFAYPDAKSFAHISVTIGGNCYRLYQRFNLGRDRKSYRVTPPPRSVMEIAHNFAGEVGYFSVNHTITDDIYRNSLVSGQNLVDSLTQVKEIVERNINTYERHGRENRVSFRKFA